MAINSTPESTFDWIARIIDTCYTPFHIECAQGLVERYRDKYGECEYWHQLVGKVAAKQPMVLVG